MKNSGCKVVLMLFVGILIGFLLTVGLVVGTGFWAYNNMTLSKVEQMLGMKIVDIGEYNDKPVKDIVAEFSTIINMPLTQLDDKFLSGNVKKNLVLTINGNTIDLTTTVFKNLLNSKMSNATSEIGKIKDNLTFGVVYDDILKAGGVQLPDSPLSAKYKDVALETALSEIGDEKISTLFENDHDFGNSMIQTVFDSIKDLTINDINDSTKLNPALDNMKINQLLDLDGTETGILKALYEEDYTLGDLKDDSSYDDLEINTILDLSNTSTGVLGAIYAMNWTLADLKVSSNFEDLNIGKILNIDPEETGILGAIRTWNLGDLTTDNINDLTLGTVLNIAPTATGILAVMKDWKLSEINEAKINTLKLGEVIEIDTTSIKMLQTLQNTTIANLSSEISNLRLADIVDLGEKDYKTDPALLAPDSYTGFIGLLYETDANEKGPLVSEINDKLNQIDVKALTLGELSDRQLITTISVADLNKTLGTKLIKEYTLDELVAYAVANAA